MIVRSFMAIALLVLGASAASAAESPFGLWRNPKNNVHIQLAPCRDRLCGVVVWANEHAKTAAAKGMDEPLVGSMLFKDLVKEGEGEWRGKIFVPNQGRTFSGAIQVLDRQTLEAKGCVLGRLFCKSQIWTRVND